MILNRPTDDDVEDMLEVWAPYASRPRVLFTGGPVEPAAVIGLARMERAQVTDAWAPVLERLGTVDLRRMPADVEPEVEALRLFVGYSGWGAGQLEAELEAGAWIVADAAPDDAFAAEPRSLWRNVLGRQRGRTRWLANFPDDPAFN